MADNLFLSKNTAVTDLLSTNTGLNPDLISGNGTTGFTVDTTLYVGNQASSGFKYDSVTITEQSDSGSINISYNTSSILGPYSDGPVTIVGSGSYITPGNYVPVYRRCIVTAGQAAQHVTTMKHRLDYTEHAV